MSGVECKHVTLSLNDKLAVLQGLDKAESLQKIAKGLNVSLTMTLKKNRKEIELYMVSLDSKNTRKNRKTLRKAQFKLLDNTPYMWFCQERRKEPQYLSPNFAQKNRSQK